MYVFRAIFPFVSRETSIVLAGLCIALHFIYDWRADSAKSNLLTGVWLIAISYSESTGKFYLWELDFFLGGDIFSCLVRLLIDDPPWASFCLQ